jgi:hypothetical protein
MRALLAAACVAALAGSALAGPNEEAAAHFARAEAAERRRDYATAIREYEAAYQAQPHPAVLYNLARVYEQLGEARKAVFFFKRYLAQKEPPEDREAVEERIAGLAARMSKVEITTTPSGARLLVDGAHAGTSPAELRLGAGRHGVRATLGDMAAPEREIELAYGEPEAIHLVLAAQNGSLAVLANVEGAEVRIDGGYVGVTPFSGPVAAGRRRVAVALAGHQPAVRDVDVPAGGGEELRVDLVPIGGEASGRPSGYFGISYGGDPRSETYRYLLAIGARTADERWEAAFVFGAYQGGGGLGGEVRLFAGTGRLRPFLRSAALVSTTAASGDDRQLGLEAGAGLLLAGTSLRNIASVDYFVEVSGHWVLSKPEVEPEGGVSLGLPIAAGIVLRYANDDR